MTINTREEFYENISIAIDTINSITNDKKFLRRLGVDYKVHNIAIVLCNKIGEISNIFKNGNIDFYESTYLSDIIKNYFIFYYNRGLKLLQSFIKKYDGEALEEYQTCVDSIYDFDLDENIEELLSFSFLGVSTNKELASSFLDEYPTIIDSLVKELEILGLNDLSARTQTCMTAIKQMAEFQTNRRIDRK